MTQTASVWLVVLLALLAANLPFASNRLFAVYALQQPKNLAVRLGDKRTRTLYFGLVALPFVVTLAASLGTPWVLVALLAAVVVAPAVRGRARFDADRVTIKWRA